MFKKIDKGTLIISLEKNYIMALQPEEYAYDD